jgi:import inner membrane translocase subunit TIM44
VLGEKLSQAQELGKATVQELFNSGSSSGTGGTKKDNGDAGTSSSASGPFFSAGGGGSNSSESDQQEDTKTSSNESSKAGISDRLRGVFTTAVQEMKSAVLPEAPTASALRGASAKASKIVTSDVTQLAVAPAAQESAWQKQFREMGDKLGGHAFFRRVASGLKDNRVVKAGEDLTESIREKWETSDSAFVHRIQDATDSFFAEGEAAQALREIRARDPGFDMVEFLRLLRADVPLLIKAYLTNDQALIKEHCSPEMIERLTGIMKAQAEAGLIPDPTLLDTSEVELVDIKMLEDAPIIVTQFTCQQINCTRDSHGNVVEGAPDEVHRVYYYWAVQQEEQGYVGEDGKAHPPRWQLREMLIRGMHHLL